LVLKFLFKKFSIGSYDKESARQIASRFGINEIDSELKSMLTKISRLGDISSFVKMKNNLRAVSADDDESL
jgi:hypothetical protein